MKKELPVYVGVALAAMLWFVMFSPWTASKLNFWLTMSASGIMLTSYAFWAGGRPRLTFSFRQVALGVALAVVLWGVFWIGDKVSQLMFGFARTQVDAIYSMKSTTPPSVIALLLLLVIGPAEELFWRSFVQRRLMLRLGDNIGFVIATLCYTLIHLWSLNFMLIMAAMVCGIIWGGLYRLRPQWLPALIVSHALWDAAAFVVFPF